jgi:hypothetical protein
VEKHAIETSKLRVVELLKLSTCISPFVHERCSVVANTLAHLNQLQHKWPEKLGLDDLKVITLLVCSGLCLLDFDFDPF